MNGELVLPMTEIPTNYFPLVSAAELLWRAIGWEHFFAGPCGMSILIAGWLCGALDGCHVLLDHVGPGS